SQTRKPFASVREGGRACRDRESATSRQRSGPAPQGVPGRWCFVADVRGLYRPDFFLVSASADTRCARVTLRFDFVADLRSLYRPDFFLASRSAGRLRSFVATPAR